MLMVHGKGAMDRVRKKREARMTNHCNIAGNDFVEVN
jgi:hypothetical protein